MSLVLLQENGSNEVATYISTIKSCRATTISTIKSCRASDIKYQVMEKYDKIEHLTVPPIFSNISAAHVEIVKAGPYDEVLLGLIESRHHHQVQGAHCRHPHRMDRDIHPKRHVFLSEIRNCRKLIQVNDNIATIAPKMEAKIVNAVVELFPEFNEVTKNEARLAEVENPKWLKNVC